MRRALTQRAVIPAATLLLVVMLVVCALALRFTVLQRRSVRAALLDLQRQAAEAKRSALEDFLLEEERRILTAIESTIDEVEALRRLRQEHRILADPILVRYDGHAELPLIGYRPRSGARTSEQMPPPEFENALRVAWSQAPLEEKYQALEDIGESESMAPQWRLRAILALAAFDRQAGDLQRALTRYDALFAEFQNALLSSDLPSFLHVAIARAECQRGAGMGAEGIIGLLDACRLLKSGTVSPTLAEGRFFHHKAAELLESLSQVESSPAADELRSSLQTGLEELETQRVSLTFTDALGDWLAARGMMDASSGETAAPQHFLDRRTISKNPESEPPSPLVAAWRPAQLSSDGSTTGAVGFRIDTGKLEDVLTGRLSEGAAEEPWRVRMSQGDLPGEFLDLSALRGDLGFVHIGLSWPAWEIMVGDAQRPFAMASALIVLLAIVLLLGFMVVVRGVRREMALAKLKTEFVANVSHELKTPLALIRLFGETLLLDRVKDSEQRNRYYQIITRESERLGHLIANVLNFASIDAGKKSYDLAPCDIGEVVRETYEGYRFHLDDKGFAHSLSVSEGLPPVMADADAVSQALINLMENAVKYSPNVKKLDVTVRSDDGAVRVSVTDRGIGIAPQDRVRIWEDYYRSREARSLGTRGSGLGLSLVHHTVEAHGGAVELESEVGRGSTFTLVFPATEISRNGDVGTENLQEAATDGSED